MRREISYKEIIWVWVPQSNTKISSQGFQDKVCAIKSYMGLLFSHEIMFMDKNNKKGLLLRMLT